MKQIYVDNAATTFPKPEQVYEGVIEAMKNIGANAGRGGYKTSRLASEILDETRDILAKLINLEDSRKVIFQPSATIATNIILNGIEWENIKNVYITPFEHNAIMRTLYSLQKKNKFEIRVIPFDNINFKLEKGKLEKEMAKNNPDLVIMSQISNTTGYILPVEEISSISKEYDSIVVVDAAQSLGILDVDIKKLNIDFMIFAGHKGLYAPFGIGGFIYVNEKIVLKPYITGGTGSESTNLEMPKDIPYKYECGSYNIEAIKGLLCGIEFILSEGIINISEKIRVLTEELVIKLKDIMDVELYIPEKSINHIGIVALNIEGYRSDEVANILDDEFNISVRAGHHCAPNVGKFLGGHAEDGILRISLGYFNESNEINKIVEAIEGIY